MEFPNSIRPYIYKNIIKISFVPDNTHFTHMSHTTIYHTLMTHFCKSKLQILILLLSCIHNSSPLAVMVVVLVLLESDKI